LPQPGAAEARHHFAQTPCNQDAKRQLTHTDTQQHVLCSCRQYHGCKISNLVFICEACGEEGRGLCPQPAADCCQDEQNVHCWCSHHALQGHEMALALHLNRCQHTRRLARHLQQQQVWGGGRRGDWWCHG
jgi:hypothetical protein